MYICVDFDGTCVKHTKPLSSTHTVPGAIKVLKRLTDAGHKLILFTLRSNKGGKMLLDEAIKWFSDNDIPIFGSQINPTQKRWTDSPKAYGSLYIDDAALGCPLIRDDGDFRPYVDWDIVEYHLVNTNVLEGDLEALQEGLFTKTTKLVNDLIEAVRNDGKV